ncbi:MAG: DUF2062 domain-containing protein [Gammaproteobacteria bacterium]|nr:DUF2062 domain-containing protein [Gammaproteobacteria bacterium]
MPKKFIKRYMPDHNKIRNNPQLNRFFGTLLHDPNLLHLNRRSVSGAFAVGLFMAFVPVPFQMFLAAAGAILFRTNLPIAVGLVWVSNPVTMPPLFYFCYKIGTFILQTPVHHIEFVLSVNWLMTELATIWQPFLLGCFVVGSLSGLIGATAVRLLWRLHVIRHMKQRRLRMKKI